MQEEKEMKLVCLLFIVMLVLVGCSPSANEQAAYYEAWQQEYDRWLEEYQWVKEYEAWSEQYGGQWYAQQNPQCNENKPRRRVVCDEGYCWLL